MNVLLLLQGGANTCFLRSQNSISSFFSLLNASGLMTNCHGMCRYDKKQIASVIVSCKKQRGLQKTVGGLASQLAGVVQRKQSYLYAHSLADKLLEIQHVPIKARSRVYHVGAAAKKQTLSQMTSVYDILIRNDNAFDYHVCSISLLYLCHFYHTML